MDLITDSKLLDRILTKDGPTSRLLAMRQPIPTDIPIQPGVWYSNFTAVRQEAERLGVPFFAMWTNGDLCGLCRRFTTNMLDPSFIERMKTSGGLWWLGGSFDADKEDGRGGAGYRWMAERIKGSTKYFPFFGVVTAHEGKVYRQFVGSGGDFDAHKAAPDGVPHIMERLRLALSSEPDTDVTTPEPKAGDGQRSGCGQKAGECPHGHPHLEALRKIEEIVHPFFRDVASRRVRFSPGLDATKRLRIVQAIADNGGHCPCKHEKTEDTVCLCRAFRETGKCDCGLFS